ncbi:MAG TPA: hypothetical protein VIK99_01325 [Thermaerobacter sp.]
MAEWWGLPAAAIIVAVVELCKQAGFPAKWAGVLAAVLGAAGGLAAHLWGGSPAVAAVVQGLVAGLAAAGLWSATKNAAGR